MDVPEYTGPTFFSAPEQRTWVPVFPRTISDADNRAITRTQFPLVLGWALTPWKAQGMTLAKVIVKLGAAVREPGVLFVALSRVRHPDDLMLDDDFPALFEILKQSKHPSYLKRQNWEKLMRAKFGRTLRLHMRDAELYKHPGTHVWTAADSDTADLLLRVANKFPPETQEDDILAAATDVDSSVDFAQLSRVWKRLHTFPYIFELAMAQHNLDSLTLQGTPSGTVTPSISPAHINKVQYQGWHVALKDFVEFRLRDKLSPSVFEHLAQILREAAPATMTFSIQSKAKKRDFSLPAPSYNSASFSSVCFPYFSPVGYLTLYVIKRILSHKNDDPKTELHILQHADIYDEHTRTTTTYLRSCFPRAEIYRKTFEKKYASDFMLLAAYAAIEAFPSYDLPDAILEDLRTRTLKYVETLERYAATSDSASVENI